MKWYHYPILLSTALLFLGVEQRVQLGEANVWIVFGSIPAMLYLSTKFLEFVTRSNI